jgi:hypothetical protein
MKTTVGIPLLVAVATGFTFSPARATEPLPEGGVFAKSNLVAWCIVPIVSYRKMRRIPVTRGSIVGRSVRMER